jgi:hypothetical protein
MPAMTGSSGNPWQQLGIAPTTDEAAIRQAYAKRLRDVRPDENPEGFQRLVEARDLALSLAQDDVNEDIQRWEFAAAPAVELHGFAQVEDASARPAPPTIDPLGTVVGSREAPEWIAVLDLLDAVLRKPSDAGWQPIADRIARLPIEDRTAVQPEVILRLSRYANDQPPEFGDWLDWSPADWPYFDLVAQLDAEFGWSEQDRIVHEILPRGEANRFLSLLAWARNVTDVGLEDLAAPATGRVPRVPRAYAYAFYDGGRDHKGLNAYRALVGSAKLWPASDAATDLFFPLWSLRDGRYLAAALGLVGWIGLVLTFAPWRSPSGGRALAWVDAHAGPLVSILIFTWPIWLALWIMLGSVRVQTPAATGNFVDMPLWQAFWTTLGKTPVGIRCDADALFFFPLWAFGRGLYVRGSIGTLAWIAVACHTLIYPAVLANVQPDPGLIGVIFLVAMFHVTAGVCGQRWVVYKLIRTIEAADRAGVNDPTERLLYIRRKRTQDPQVLRKAGRALGMLLIYLLIFIVGGAVLRALSSLREGRW